jgi:hypothetical protein
MTDTHRTYWDEIDFAAIARDHPIGDPFVKLVTSISRDELRQQLAISAAPGQVNPVGQGALP